jgi:hypothetical protein
VKRHFRSSFIAHILITIRCWEPPMTFLFFPRDEVLAAMQNLHLRLEVAIRVAEFGSLSERRRHAESIVAIVMGMPATELTVGELKQRLVAADDPTGSTGMVASLEYFAARACLDAQSDSLSHLLAKLEVNKMEKRLIGFVNSAGVPAWPHSCEFIVAPYASAAQFGRVQAKYAADRRSSSLLDSDPKGFAGA